MFSIFSIVSCLRIKNHLPLHMEKGKKEDLANICSKGSKQGGEARG
jgi:hypothetical protein